MAKEKTITQRVAELQKVAKDAHERICMNDKEDCWICAVVYDETLVSEVDDIHKIASAEHL